jgi:hypothetical protein
MGEEGLRKEVTSMLVVNPVAEHILVLKEAA